MNLKDFSLSAVVAGLLAVFISFAGPVAIVFQAARLAGLSDAMTSSWIWAISLGSGIAGLLLSYRLKMPVLAAWSTPGAALLVVSLPVVGIHQAVGAYIVSALLVLALGLSGAFKVLLEHVPKGIIAAMLAGVLFNFGAHAINPSVIAASICTGVESNEDPAKRYVAGIAAGMFYLLIAVFGGTLAQLMAALPKELVVTLAGLALVGSITTGLVGLVTNEGHRDASVITFLVAASGMSLLGLGAAFWSLVIGALAYLILHQRWGRAAFAAPAAQQLKPKA